MPETLTYTTWQDWVDRADTESRLKQYAPGDTSDVHPKVTTAEKAGIGEMNSYLRKRGIRLPLDNPLPEHVKAHLLSLGTWFLTMRSEDPVGKTAYDAAIDFFKRVAAGQVMLEDSNTSTPEGSVVTPGIIYVRRQPDFDFDNFDSPAGIRIPRL